MTDQKKNDLMRIPAADLGGVIAMVDIALASCKPENRAAVQEMRAFLVSRQKHLAEARAEVNAMFGPMFRRARKAKGGAR